MIPGEQYDSQDTSILLIISPERVKDVLVPNTGRRLYAYFLEKEMYRLLEVVFDDVGPLGQPCVLREWKRKLEEVVIELLGLSL